MNLVIDIGNTLTKVAVFRHSELLRTEQRASLSVDWLSSFIGQHLETSPPPGIIISSVSDKHTAVIRWLQRIGKIVRFTPATPLPIKINYKTPDTLGTDRLAAAAGAVHHYGHGNILVFQAGSCLTHELVTSGGVYEGGGISPGLKMRLKSLHTFTRRLPLVEYRDIDFLAGKTTEESILGGVFSGMVAEIDGTIDRYREKFNDLTVVMTGGDLIYFDKRLKNSIFAHPNLVLEGLNIILEFNELVPQTTPDRLHRTH